VRGVGWIAEVNSRASNKMVYDIKYSDNINYREAGIAAPALGNPAGAGVNLSSFCLVFGNLFFVGNFPGRGPLPMGGVMLLVSRRRSRYSSFARFCSIMDILASDQLRRVSTLSLRLITERSE